MNTNTHAIIFVESKVSLAVNNANIIVIIGCRYMNEPITVGDNVFNA